MAAETNQFNEVDLYEAALNLRDASDLPLKMQPILTHFFNKENKKCLELIHLHAAEARTPIESIYLLHLQTLIYDREYDVKAYEGCLSNWEQLIYGDQSGLVLQFYKLHTGILAYFECRYSEAYTIFNDLLENKNLPVMRVTALSAFHLGLIQRNQGNTAAAEDFFLEAFQFAAAAKNKLLLERVKAQLEKIKSNLLFTLDLNLQKFLISSDLKTFKKAYLLKRKQNVKINPSRGVCNLHGLLPAYFIKLGQKKKAVRLVSRINDSTMKIEAIKLIKMINPSFHELNALLSMTESKVSLNILLSQGPKIEASENLSLNALSSGQLELIQEEEIYLLAKALLGQVRPVDKSYICKQVWNIEYDPTIHDQKIYKAIHRFRKYFNNKDIILNFYGKYKLNAS